MAIGSSSEAAEAEVGGSDECLRGEGGRAAKDGGGEKGRGELDREDDSRGAPADAMGEARPLDVAEIGGSEVLGLATTLKIGLGNDGGFQSSSSSSAVGSSGTRLLDRWERRGSGRRAEVRVGEPERGSSDRDSESREGGDASRAVRVPPLVRLATSKEPGDLESPEAGDAFGVHFSLSRTGLALGLPRTSYSPVMALPKPTPLGPKSRA